MSEQAFPGAGAAGSVGSVSSPTTDQPTQDSTTATPTAWVGWIYFGGAMMILLGSFNVIMGLVALFDDNYFVPTPSGLLVFDLTGWGWVHLIVGALAVITGLGLFTGAMWARIAAVVLAGINAIAQLTFLSAYPVWATIVIVLDVLVIWAVIVHGEEAKERADW